MDEALDKENAASKAEPLQFPEVFHFSDKINWKFETYRALYNYLLW